MSERRIEDKMKDVLDGTVLQDALAFAKFLQACDVEVSGVDADGGVQVTYNGDSIGFILVKGGEGNHEPWIIWLEGDYSSMNAKVPFDERMKEIVWANVNPCGSELCGNCSEPGIRRIVFGKEFNNICRYTTLKFVAPDAEALKCLDKVFEMRKNEILGRQ